MEKNQPHSTLILNVLTQIYRKSICAILAKSMPHKKTASQHF
jgi:hypothetical protein